MAGKYANKSAALPRKWQLETIDPFFYAAKCPDFAAGKSTICQDVQCPDGMSPEN